MRMFAKKSLGQNFLHAPWAFDAICTAADLQPTDIVLEIGPGQGALTKHLLAKAGKVIAIEKDDRLIPILSVTFENEIRAGKFVLVHGDVLEAPLPKSLTSGSYKLVANIPYYITGMILQKFLSGTSQPSRAVLMVQKEVAKRIVANDEVPSILSNSVWVYGEPEFVATVSRGSFQPVPNVDSAILLIKNISKKRFDGLPESFYFNVLKKGFHHKRKLLLQNLEIPRAIQPDVCTAVGIHEKARAEELTTEQWLTLARFLHELSAEE